MSHKQFIKVFVGYINAVILDTCVIIHFSGLQFDPTMRYSIYMKENCICLSNTLP